MSHMGLPGLGSKIIIRYLEPRTASDIRDPYRAICKYELSKARISVTHNVGDLTPIKSENGETEPTVVPKELVDLDVRRGNPAYPGENAERLE